MELRKFNKVVTITDVDGRTFEICLFEDKDTMRSMMLYLLKQVYDG